MLLLLCIIKVLCYYLYITSNSFSTCCCSPLSLILLRCKFYFTLYSHFSIGILWSPCLKRALSKSKNKSRKKTGTKVLKFFYNKQEVWKVYSTNNISVHSIAAKIYHQFVMRWWENQSVRAVKPERSAGNVETKVFLPKPFLFHFDVSNMANLF